MRILLGVYIFICIMLFLFNIGFLVVKNIKKEKLFSINNDIKKNLVEQLKKYNPQNGFSGEFKKYLLKELRKTKNIIVIMEFLEAEKEISKESIIEIRDIIIELDEIYIKKVEMEKAYYPYALSTFDYGDVNFTKTEKGKLVDFLDCKSIYTFINTMELVYKISDLELLEMALNKIDKSDIFYHKKLLIDGLMKYNGDANELVELIKRNFYSYKDELKEALIDFCRMKRLDIDELCIENLYNEYEIYPEVRYSSMRYFISNKTNESKEYSLNLLQRENLYWLDKMLSIQILSRYDDEKVYESIKEHITDRNWYVRNATIKYVHRHNIGKEEIFSIMEKHDKFTNEELLYEYKDDKEISDYIKETIIKFEEEEKNLSEGRVM